MLDYREEYRLLCQQVITSLRAGNTQEASNYQILLEALEESERRSLEKMGDELEAEPFVAALQTLERFKEEPFHITL